MLPFSFRTVLTASATVDSALTIDLSAAASVAAERIRVSEDPLFLREDFDDLGDAEAVDAVLERLREAEVILPVSDGVYARTSYSEIWGKILPEESVVLIARRYAERVGARLVPTRSDRAYLAGRSTQVATGRVIGVDRPIAKRFGLGADKSIRFEYVRGRGR